MGKRKATVADAVSAKEAAAAAKIVPAKGRGRKKSTKKKDSAFEDGADTFEKESFESGLAAEKGDTLKEVFDKEDYPSGHQGGGAFNDDQAERAIDDPDNYTKAEQAHYREIIEKQKRVRVLRSENDDAKAAAKVAKNRYDTAAEELCDLIARGAQSAQPTLPGFDDDDDPDAVRSMGRLADHLKPGAAADGWRILPVSESGASPAICAALESAGLLTLGQVADHTKDGATLPNLGEDQAVEYVDAIDDFFNRHPEFSPAAAPDAPQEESADE